ncbi:maleylpyruvate isomerase family mycothiol-dependent enzyme [Streptomyces litchfieldiae]|uniref:Maleylpyruvate isomerase family mycothiol-dependent enzyme n=1 Tax=Streptomyces litchfieldiae TaxID=3075543 RepID=A0ABU2MKZ1_9ACTN|nr:maleylpyruvate isomerase family mycothiol-dependent enzyme [Streptomyces sp. DSM 44938]MDT0342257.1 maleylpyruvate isomerase family mycothiol-dependent enzyme [Streptomyces sp. DSM 44938]
MTVHPSLQPSIDAWTQTIEAISELVSSLVDGEWNRPTECPGWSVRDVVSHVIGGECEALGDPRPIHTLPRDLYHVTDETTRYLEVQVDVRRHHTGPEMTSELEYTIIRRARQLRNERRKPEDVISHPLYGKMTLADFLDVRVFDIWTHEQDIRRALRRPGGLDSPAAHIARDVLLERLPKVIAEDAGAPKKSAVVFDVSGPVEFLRTVRVDENGNGTVDSSPSLGPIVTFTTDWETFSRLVGGRVRAKKVADKLKVEGEAALADRILASFPVAH